MAKGKLTMKRCPNGKIRKCPNKYKKCSKKLNAKAKSFKIKSRSQKLNPLALSFKMKGGKVKTLKKSKKGKVKKENMGCTSNIFMGIGFDVNDMKKPKIKSKKIGGKKKSNYNKFMSEELKKIKKNNPNIDHKKAFKMAAANWKK